MDVFAWNTLPDLNRLAHFLHHHPQRKTLLFRLPENQTLPEFAPSSPLFRTWQNATRCIQFHAPNILADFAPQTDIYLLPFAQMAQLHDLLGEQHIIWQTPPIAQHPPAAEKPWQKLPEPPHHFSGSPHVLVIGAGIAGAATAYELARRGAHVQVLEAAEHVACGGSGNRQGLLYAKISPHNTPQTTLLLAGYGYTRRLLDTLLPDKTTWHDSGVLHLNHNAAETARNAQLAAHTHHRHLYRAVSATEASRIAGVPIAQSALYWQHGAWLNPASLVRALLAHPNISLHTRTALLAAEHDGTYWRVRTRQGEFSGSHIVFCTGAHSQKTPIIQAFPTHNIRGQTSLAYTSPAGRALKTALSGGSYLAPAWHNQHCFGATFLPNDPHDDWREADHQHNWQTLAELNADLFHSLHAQKTLSGSLKGHAALRNDSHDHLPVIGALGDAAAMRRLYAQLRLDKNYRLHSRCPYLPHAYANIAHGSRGLATAPICAAQIAAQICLTPHVLPHALRLALQPNRLIIRQIVRGENVQAA